MVLVRALAAVACAAFLARPASAQTAALRREVAEVGVTERLGAAVPTGAAFTDTEGRPVSLSALAGRPVLLSFNYTSCPRLCGLQLGGLARALRDLGWQGQGFSVVTVSIDPGETLPQLRRYREAFVRQAGGGDGPSDGWRFLVGARRDVDALADAVGFRYRYDPRTGEFAHQATLVVLTGEGRVSGYLHGVSYAREPLREALARAASGRVSSAAEQAGAGGFLLTCMGFDPADPAPRALRWMRAGGVAALAFLLLLVGGQLLRGSLRPAGRGGPGASARRRGARAAP
ncbi:MAG TPA: SCO family protein [Anaeromyxobacteraceae bacterium]|nr:SCO family protein [Anaeromyxobacteraceae bacterium]